MRTNRTAVPPAHDSHAMQPIEASQSILAFPNGLPGFASHRQFVLSPDDACRDSAPVLFFLKSLSDPKLTFVLVPVLLIDPAYQLSIETWDCDLLFPGTEPFNTSLLTSFFILSSSPDGFTVNLLAPVVVRRDTATAVQAVRSDALYSHAAPLRPAHPARRGPVC